MVWYLCLIGVITLGLVSIVGTGGDDDGGGSDTLRHYNFTIDMDPVEKNGVSAEPQAVVVLPDKPGPLVVSYSDDSGDYILELSGVVYGSIDTKDGDYTIFDELNEASTIVQAMEGEGSDEYFGPLTLNVTADIEIPEEDPPATGAWTVQSGDETITVTVGVDQEKGAGVTITTTDQTQDPFTKFYGWGEFFEYLLDSDEPEWQRKAAFSGSIIRFLIENSQFLTTTFDIIPDLEDVLEDEVPVRDYCSAFNEGENPADVRQEGYNDFTWFDVSDDGEVGGGDSFQWEFVDCWDDDPEDDIDDLLNGTIDLRGYTEVEDGGKTVRIGYELPGGVEFTEFCLSEIEEVDEGVYTHDTTYAVTVNGGFTIVFYEPED